MKPKLLFPVLGICGSLACLTVAAAEVKAVKSLRVEALIEQARYDFLHAGVKEAISRVDRALQEARQDHDVTGEAVAARDRALFLGLAEKPAEAEQAWLESVKLAEGYFLLQALAGQALFSGQEGQDSLTQYSARASDPTNGLEAVRSLNETGVALMRAQSFPEARGLFEVARKLSEAKGAGSLEQAVVLFNQAYLIMQIKGRRVDARSKLTQALAIFEEKVPNTAAHATTLSSLLRIAELENDEAEVRQLCTRTRTLLEQMDNQQLSEVKALAGNALLVTPAKDVARGLRVQLLSSSDRLAIGSSSRPSSKGGTPVDLLEQVMNVRPDRAFNWLVRIIALQEGWQDLKANVQLQQSADLNLEGVDPKLGEQILQMQKQQEELMKRLGPLLSKLGQAVSNQNKPFDDSLEAVTRPRKIAELAEKLPCAQPAPGAVTIPRESLPQREKPPAGPLGENEMKSMWSGLFTNMGLGTPGLDKILLGRACLTEWPRIRQEAFAGKEMIELRAHKTSNSGPRKPRPSFPIMIPGIPMQMMGYKAWGGMIIDSFVKQGDLEKAWEYVEDVRGIPESRARAEHQALFASSNQDLRRSIAASREALFKAQEDWVNADRMIRSSKAGATQPDSSLEAKRSEAAERIKAQSEAVNAMREQLHVTNPPPMLTVARACGMLPSNSVFVAFLYESSSERGHVFLLRRTSGGGAFVGKPINLLRQTIMDYRARLTRQDSDAEQIRKTAWALFQKLFPEETADWVRQADRLIVSPDGDLWDIPFATLILNASGPPEFLGLAKRLSFSESFPVPGADEERPPQGKAGWADSAVILGGSLFEQGTRSVFATLQQETLADLPQSRAEAERIARLYRSEPLIGEKATEANLRRRLPGARMVHLATHGLAASAPLMVGDVGESLVRSEGFPGLWLTAPKTAVDHTDDGLIQAWEISSELDLKADLVVLSACETARSATLFEGARELPNCWLHAGVKAVVGSSWRVSDESAALLMGEFHRRLIEGKEKDEALRLAMAFVAAREETQHPYHWAPFSISGSIKPML